MNRVICTATAKFWFKVLNVGRIYEESVDVPLAGDDLTAVGVTRQGLEKIAGAAREKASESGGLFARGICLVTHRNADPWLLASLFDEVRC